MQNSGLDIFLWAAFLILVGTFLLKFGFQKGKEGIGLLAFIFISFIICLIAGVVWMALFSADLTGPILFSVMIFEFCVGIGVVAGHAYLKS